MRADVCKKSSVNSYALLITTNHCLLS